MDKLKKAIRIGMRNSIKRYGKSYTREQGKRLVNTLKIVEGEQNKIFLSLYMEEYCIHFPNVQL